MKYYRVTIVIPDSDSVERPMVVWSAAICMAGETPEKVEENANREWKEYWESPDETGVSMKDSGLCCPVCNRVVEITPAQYRAWEVEMESLDNLPF